MTREQIFTWANELLQKSAKFLEDSTEMEASEHQRQTFFLSNNLDKIDYAAEYYKFPRLEELRRDFCLVVAAHRDRCSDTDRVIPPGSTAAEQAALFRRAAYDCDYRANHMATI